MIRAALLWLLICLPAMAQEQTTPEQLPDWEHTSVNDFAHLLTPEDVQILDQALIKLFKETDIEGTVVTLTDRARYGGDRLEPFATRLFNHWGVGDAERNDGFMILVLQHDREARIELGDGYPPEADRVAQQITDSKMLPAYRAGQMSQGIRDGTLAVIEQIARPAATGKVPEPRRRGIGDWLPGVVAAGFFSFIFYKIGKDIFRRIQYGRRSCPNCGGRGLVEEIEPVTAETATGQSVARQSVWTRCPKCGWKHHETRDAPRRTRSSRSRGGFGGGRSSGGGASGRW